MEQELRSLAEKVCSIAKDTGKAILTMEQPEIFTKEGHANFVTSADIAAQKQILECLAPLLPSAHIFAEEQAENELLTGYNWIIDPIDGTTNFMRGCQRSAISIGLVIKDQTKAEAVLGAVYNPYADELFWAVKGAGAFCGTRPIHASKIPLEEALICFGASPYYRNLADETFHVMRELFRSCADLRRSGSAALDLCDVACGRCDGFYEALLSPWDYAASSVILTEAGALIGSAPDQPLCYGHPVRIAAGNPFVYKEILHCFPSKE